MTPQVDRSFIRNFEAEVHVQYQQMGSKLRNTVRTKDNVTGLSTIFYKLGSSVPPVQCELRDYFAGDWIDDLDALRVNIHEQLVVAKASAYALGRKSDELIVAALADVRSRVFPSEREGLSREKVLVVHGFVEESMPDDGQRFAVVGWKQWADLLAIEEFANADYVNEDELPWKGTQAKRWLGTLWLPHSGLPKSGDVRRCFWYHKTAIGHAIGPEVRTDVTWHGDRASHFVNNMLSQGACVIDAERVVCLPCLEK